MYWGQISIALFAATVTLGISYQYGQPALVAVLMATVAYVIVRWLVGWGFRIRYWYQRGTRGIYSRSCADCGQYIYRRRRTWILECERCGWTAGLPVVRWITHSIPGRQLRRTIVGPRLVLVTAIIGILLLGGVGGGITAITPSEIGANNTDRGSPINLSSANLSPDLDSENSSTPGPNVEEGYNRTLVERHFIERYNDERSSRGLQTVTKSPVLSEMGKKHSEDMAKHDYIGHTDSAGRNIKDRYEGRGLLPECHLDIKGSNRYYPGAENAAGAYVERRFTSTGGSYYVADEQELAEALFSIWMNSPPHRRAMLVHSADEAGLGVTITESGKVYAALELC